MLNFNLIFKIMISTVIVAYSSNNLIAASDKSNLTEIDNPKNIAELKLQPKIKISPNQSKLKAFDLNLLKFYLRKFIVIENPKLQLVKSKSITEFKKPVVPITDLELDEDSRYVVGFDQSNINLGDLNTKILVSGLAADSHFNYMLVVPDFSYYHPITLEYLGTVVKNTGIASIVKRGKLSILNIDKFYEPISRGMLVIPSRSLNVFNKIKVVPGIANLNGYILSVIPYVTKAAVNNIVIIGLGNREGVKVGNIFKVINKEFKIQDPYHNNKEYTHRTVDDKGEILIYDVFEKLSLGILTKCSQDISVLDQVISS